jgi:hypothetical protein
VLGLVAQHKKYTLKEERRRGKGRRKGGEGWNPFTFSSE